MLGIFVCGDNLLFVICVIVDMCVIDGMIWLDYFVIDMLDFVLWV